MFFNQTGYHAPASYYYDDEYYQYQYDDDYYYNYQYYDGEPRDYQQESRHDNETVSIDENDEKDSTFDEDNHEADRKRGAGSVKMRKRSQFVDQMGRPTQVNAVWKSFLAERIGKLNLFQRFFTKKYF